MRRTSMIMLATLIVLMTSPTPSRATTLKCQRTIAKASTQFVQAKMKALQKCENGVVNDGAGSCPDDKAAAAISKASTKLQAAIGKSCGGDDKLCGGDLTNEDTPASVGWPAACPNFEHGSCNGPIASCGDIAACVECIAEDAADQAAALYYGDLVLPSSGDLNKCQGSIGKATSAFLKAKSKALQKCWDAELNGKLPIGNTCIDPNPGDGKYLAAIAKAQTKKDSAICKACGGADQACGGGDDLMPAQIGFPASCPAVTIPGGAACGGAITDLQSIVDCVDCVTEFKVDCVDRLSVPELVSYPSECNVCTAPPPAGACPTSFQFTADGPSTELDIGFTGLDFNQSLPSDARLTLTVSGCAGASQPTCGQCNLSGPIDNAGGAAFANHRCADATWVMCSTDLDCTNAGASGPCTFFLGAPEPVGVGGVPVCVLNRIDGAVSGTVDTGDGSASIDIPIARGIFPTGTLTSPCPRCVAGSCDDGPRDGLACTIGGTGAFGDVSLDCPPAPGAHAGDLVFIFPATTGTQTETLDASSVACRQTGYTTRRCFCDTCNNAGDPPFQTCSANADCPLSGGQPGVCGGARCSAGTESGKPCNTCVGGSNAGGRCTTATACPGGVCQTGCAGGGSCIRPGEPTQPNTCLDDESTASDGTICTDLGNGHGECPEGPMESVCSIEQQRGCINDQECNPPSAGGTCSDCALGQTCVDRPRPCFPGGGLLGEMVSVAGSADAPCGSVSSSVLDGLFCVPPVAATSVNSTVGLTGLARIRLPGTLVLQ